METPRKVLRNKYTNAVQEISTPIRIPPSPFLKTLGFGTCVNVYRLDRSPKCGQIRSPWAVKRVTSRSRANGDEELFSSRILIEAEILRNLKHPNIVGFRGMTKDVNGIETLALECCETSLGSILEEQLEEELGPLPAVSCKKMMRDIGKALDYLHTEAKILHGDVKSFNVLVKGDFEICKLCDFGVSIPLDENDEINFAKNPKLRYVGTDLWSAPEVMDDSEVIDSKADIFSFGLVIYEMLALVPPHTLDVDDEEDNKENTEESIDKSQDLESEQENTSLANDESLNIQRAKWESACGTRPPLPQSFILSEDYIPVVELFYLCTNELSEDRPSARVIWQSIESMEAKEANKTEENAKPVI